MFRSSRIKKNSFNIFYNDFDTLIPPKPMLMVSGGLDSEIIHRLYPNIPTMFARIWHNGVCINQKDIQYLDDTTMYMDINLLDVWNTQYILEFCSVHKMNSPQFIMHYHIATEIKKLGYDPLYCGQQLEIMKWGDVAVIQETYKGAVMRHALAKADITNTMSYIHSSYAKIKEFMKEAIQHYPFANKSEYYYKVFGIQMDHRPKSTGFELVKELDHFFRKFIFDNFKHCDDRIYIPVDAIIGGKHQVYDCNTPEVVYWYRPEYYEFD